MSQIRKIKDMRTSSSSACSSPIAPSKSAIAKSAMATAAAAALASGGGQQSVQQQQQQQQQQLQHQPMQQQQQQQASAQQPKPPSQKERPGGAGPATPVAGGKIIGNVTPQKKVTMVDKDEELVASSPSERNWRGIFIALLVIAVVLGMIMFSIVLLSPEDEGQRVKGRRLTLADVNGPALQWRGFNGSWIHGSELLYRDPSGGLSIMTPETGAIRVLMTDSAFRQLNAHRFSVSPDLKYVLLAATDAPATGGQQASINSNANAKNAYNADDPDACPDIHPETARYSVYEVANRNIFPLSHLDGALNPPLLQLVRWAPVPPKVPAPLVVPAGAAGIRSEPVPPPQGIAFVHANDVYYKPRVQHDLVCRLTTSGLAGLVYNGVPDWLYANTADLRGGDALAFSPDGAWLAFVAYNDSAVDRYEYTWLGDSWKYPQIRSIRYPKEGSRQPNVTVFVVDLSALKLIQRIRVQPPVAVLAQLQASGGLYVGRVQWASATQLSVTWMDRAQSVAVTALCTAPAFVCHAAHTETTADGGATVLVNDAVVYSQRSRIGDDDDGDAPVVVVAAVGGSGAGGNRSATTAAAAATQTAFGVNEFDAHGGTNGGGMGGARFMLKRLPVRDGEHGYYRHVVFVSASGNDRRTVALTMGQFEVTELLGWHEPSEMVFFMAAPYQRPGERHLYRVRVSLNVTRAAPNRVFVRASPPMCLTCDNGAHTFRLPVVAVEPTAEGADNETSSEAAPSAGGRAEPEIPNNCLYNRVHMSPDFAYYVQECLGPEVPSVYLVETQTRQKVAVLHAGDLLRQRVATVARPQIQVFQVEIRHGFHAQVRLMLPPGMRVDEDVAFPMILHVDASPGSQLVTQRFAVDWNWYLCSKRSMIVAQIDGRGSAGQGERLRQQMTGHLGTVEIEDQLGVLTYLRDKFRFIDPTRICAYGWGYGGYAASMVLAEDSQRVLQCAAAVNPIVSFAHHSTFFTDRYMPASAERLRALQSSDLSMRAGNMDSRNFFLVHGTADTLVHQQHSLMLARSLIDQGVGFRHQVYTDEGHRLAGVLTHLYKTLEWFFDESFGPADTGDWDPTGFFAFKQ